MGIRLGWLSHRSPGPVSELTWQESTAENYRLINCGIARRCGGLHSARLLLHSFDFARIAALQAAGAPDGRILEIGCGTGSLVLLLKQAYPGAEVIALDPNPKALARARRKAERADVTVQFERGFAEELPYAGASFDLVVSSLMFRHLSIREKEQMLREVRRMLKSSGRFHMLDFAGPGANGHTFLSRWIHSSPHLKDKRTGSWGSCAQRG